MILIPLNWRENFQTLTDQIHLLQPQLILKGNGNIGYPLQSVTDEGSHKSPMLEKTTTESAFNDSALIPWFLMHTSGSSGNTKAVIYIEDMIAMNTLRVTKTVNLNEHTVNATVLPDALLQKMQDQKPNAKTHIFEGCAHPPGLHGALQTGPVIDFILQG